VALGVSTGLFSPDEADALLRDTLREHFVDTASAAPASAPRAHARVVDGADGAPAGWAFLRAESAAAPAGEAAEVVPASATAGTAEAVAQAPAPSVAASTVWELMWIGTSRSAEGTGVGRALLADAEALAARGGAARLLISTSATTATARARAFYERNGYAAVSLDKNFYGEGDDRVLYARALASGVVSASAAAAAAAPAAIVCVSPPSLAPPGGHYSHAVRAGGFVFVSGQLPITPAGEKLVGAPFEAQAQQTLRNVAAALAGAGSSVDKLVQVRVYVTDVAHWPAFNALYAAWAGAVRPARAVVPVPQLHFGLLVEVEATALA